MLRHKRRILYGFVALGAILGGIKAWLLWRKREAESL